MNKYDKEKQSNILDSNGMASIRNGFHRDCSDNPNPAYFLILIGTWKLLGVVAVLIPKFPLVKEWAYAGFFFLTTGALFTHMAVGDKSAEYFGASLLLVLTILSWYFRPNDRKLLIALK
jgi:hypothetical protein